MDPELEAFEAARSDRAKRTDYKGHVLKAAIVDMAKSKHRERTRHEGTAADLARTYVAAHPEMEALYGGASLEDLVNAVDLNRAAGNEEQRIKLDAWLMAMHPPQHIKTRHTGTEED